MGALPEDLVDVVDVLALAGPLGVSVLAGLTSPAGVEEAEVRGLVELRQDGRRWQATLAHPLYGEVRRSQIGQLRARRLRGEITAALPGSGGRGGGASAGSRAQPVSVAVSIPPG